MAVPIPPKCILERPKDWGPWGIILENMLSIKVFLRGGASLRRRMFNPQNVKNKVTSIPMAAAPLAMMKLAMARSKSLLKTTMVRAFLVGAPADSEVETLVGVSFFSIMAVNFPWLGTASTRRLPERLHQAWASMGNPGSEAVMRKYCPGFNPSIFSFILRRGPGHWRPQASSSIISPEPVESSWGELQNTSLRGLGSGLERSSSSWNMVQVL